MSVVKFLSEVNGFSSISLEDLETIASQLEERHYKKGEYLIKKGDAGNTMHIIVSGKVAVPLTDSNGDRKMVVHLGPRDLVGEMALLTGERRTADVIADQKVKTLVMDRETLQPLLGEHPPLARFLTEILGKRLEQGGGIEWVGKYRLLGKLGEGATAKVYQAIHPGLDRVVAIKMLSHSLLYDSTFKERFMQEARTIAGLTHPNIVQIFDTEACYATYFIVMEKVEGTDLAKLLATRKVLSPEETCDILRQLCRALCYAHNQGIVHRDVKPANCAVDPNGDVKLMDFGIARRIQKSPSQKRAKMVEGTPRYLAPESAMGKQADGRADIYALGIMGYEMATGRVPFYSDTIRELLQMHVRKAPVDVAKVRPGLPQGLCDFIMGALAKRPEERLSDFDKMDELLGGSGTPSAEVRPYSDDRSTDVLSIRYPVSQAERISQAISDLSRDLSDVEEVEISHASLRPLTGGAGATQRPGSAARPTQPTAAMDTLVD